MKWKTKTTYVDNETGEELRKEHVSLGHYVIIKKEYGQTKFTNDYGERKIKYICRKNNQTRIEWGPTNIGGKTDRKHAIHGG